MHQDKCSHVWEMINVVYGFIITEKCHDCDQVSTYFSLEDKPPLEEYREGGHFWNFMEGAQSFRFDIKCTQCGTLVKFNELLGLMMCTGCEETCEVDILRRKLEPERTWVYVAFGYLPIEERQQLSPEKISILEDYFNQSRRSSKSRIKIVSQEMIKSIARCYMEVIKDIDMLSLTPPEGR